MREYRDIDPDLYRDIDSLSMQAKKNNKENDYW